MNFDKIKKISRNFSEISFFPADIQKFIWAVHMYIINLSFLKNSKIIKVKSIQNFPTSVKFFNSEKNQTFSKKYEIYDQFNVENRQSLYAKTAFLI